MTDTTSTTRTRWPAPGPVGLTAAGFALTLIAFACYITIRVAQTGLTARTIGALFLTAVGLTTTGWTLAQAVWRLAVAVRRPARGDAGPLTADRRRAVMLAVGHIVALDPHEEAALAAAHARVAGTGRWRRLLNRMIDLADAASRLYDPYGGEGFNAGAEALAAVADVPGAYEAILAVLVADIAHPDDVADLLGPWTAAHLDPPDLDTDPATDGAGR